MNELFMRYQYSLTVSQVQIMRAGPALIAMHFKS